MTDKPFTTSQLDAIESNASDIVVLAGAGSGKTEVFARRIRRLIASGIHPSQIVAITFTNVGALEIEERIGRSANTNGDESMPYHHTAQLGFIGTVHGFALKMLKEYGEIMGYGEHMTVINPDNAADLLLSKSESLGCKLAIDKLMKLKSEIGRPKGRLSVPETVIAAYYDDLCSAGMVDFDVLLTEFARMLEETDALAGHFKYLFVDEVQDSASIDWRIYHRIQISNKFFVGDPDQAIFGFRGGNISGLINYAKREGVTLIKLQENFRSHSEICNAANALISCNMNRLDKQTISVKGPGGQVHAFLPDRNAGAEIAGVIDIIQDYGSENDVSIAILARTNQLADEFRKAIDAAGYVVNKRPEREAPKDFHLARTLIELLVYPENDTLGFFYLIARAIAHGATPNLARIQAHDARREAAASFNSINSAALGFPMNLTASNVSRILDDEGVSTESQMLVAEKLRELPDGSPMIELAFLLTMNPKPAEKIEQEGKIIHILTCHAAKGREFDVVFLVGFEDEIIPGRRKNMDIEEERRLAYVGITRARKAIYITNSSSRITPWGSIVEHSPSRFVKEIGFINI